MQNRNIHTFWNSAMKRVDDAALCGLICSGTIGLLLTLSGIFAGDSPAEDRQMRGAAFLTAFSLALLLNCAEGLADSVHEHVFRR